MKPAVAVAAVLSLSSVYCLAEKNADLKPVLLTPGKVTAEESFSGTALPEGWKVMKGSWEFSDGAASGKEKVEDHHPAVLMLVKPNHDSILRLSYKFDGAKFLSLNYNTAKAHAFRVIIAPDKVTLYVDKDENDPTSKVAILGTAHPTFEPGKWYTVQVEVKGPDIVAQGDNGWTLKGSNPKIDVDKGGYRFAGGGETVVLDDVKIWEAAP